MIPKIIHYCWVGNNPLPKSAQKCIKSWKKFCPDYQIIEWNESNYDFSKNKYMKDAYDKKKWGFVPDYARLDIVYNYGGIYLDTDVEIVKSFNDLLVNEGFAGFESDEYLALGLGFGAEKGNAIIRDLMEAYESVDFILPDGTMNLTPSPQINKDVFEKHGFVWDGSMQKKDGFLALPVDYLCPKSFVDGVIRRTANTHSIHHFDASWYTEEQQKEKFARWAEEKRLKREKQKEFVMDYCCHLPNHIAMRIFGEKQYERLKKILKRNA